MVNSCCAFNCNVKTGEGYSFHKFPDDQQLSIAWCLAIRRKNFKPTKYTRLCSKHFTLESYLSERFGFPTLKRDAVPSLFDFSNSTGGMKKNVISGKTKKKVVLSKPRKQSRKLRRDKSANDNQDASVKRSAADINDTDDPRYSFSLFPDIQLVAKERYLSSPDVYSVADKEYPSSPHPVPSVVKNEQPSILVHSVGGNGQLPSITLSVAENRQLPTLVSSTAENRLPLTLVHSVVKNNKPSILVPSVAENRRPLILVPSVVKNGQQTLDRSVAANRQQSILLPSIAGNGQLLLVVPAVENGQLPSIVQLVVQNESLTFDIQPAVDNGHLSCADDQLSSSDDHSVSEKCNDSVSQILRKQKAYMGDLKKN